MHSYPLDLNASLLWLTERCYPWSFAFLRIIFAKKFGGLISGRPGDPSCRRALSGDSTVTAGVSVCYTAHCPPGDVLWLSLGWCWSPTAHSPAEVIYLSVLTLTPNMTSLLKKFKSAFVTANIFSVQLLFTHNLKIAINDIKNMSFELLYKPMVSSACVFQLIN